MNSLLFSLPGTPVIYYGDEIGMGDNFYLGDRNGVRTPMQWSADRNAGFSRANPQRLYLPVIIDPEYHYEAINVEAQQNNPHSLLWWMKRLHPAAQKLARVEPRRFDSAASGQPPRPGFRARIRWRARSGGGEPIALRPRRRNSAGQVAGHDAASRCSGARIFPPITDRPYFVSLGPHAFLLVPAAASRGLGGNLARHLRATETPVLTVPSWQDLFSAEVQASLSRMMPAIPTETPLVSAASPRSVRWTCSTWSIFPKATRISCFCVCLLPG